MRCVRKASRGIGLVEVLIVIGIVGLLVSLLTPAVQMAREASRKASCASNIRQLGIGLQQYHDVHRMFPPTGIWGPAGEPLGKGLAPPGTIDRISAGVDTAQSPDRMFASWTLMLFPFIEEEEAFDSYDRHAPVAAVQNETVRATDIPLLKCPTDYNNGPDNYFQRAGLMAPDQRYARTNYAMNAGPNELCLARLGPKGKLNTCVDGFQVDGSDLESNTRQVWGSGIGGLNRSFRMRDIVSGTSKMIAIEEIRAGVDPEDRRGVWALGFPGCSVTAAHGTKGNGGPNVGADHIQGCTALSNRFSGDLSLEGMACFQASSESREVCEQATARSLHFSGVNVLMADGSCRFIEDEIDPDVWERSHKRNNTVPLQFEFD